MRERNQIRGILGIPVRSTGLWVRTLVTFEEARAAYECGQFSGVGYSLDDGNVALR